jgi:hypothetical protein
MGRAIQANNCSPAQTNPWANQLSFELQHGQWLFITYSPKHFSPEEMEARTGFITPSIYATASTYRLLSSLVTPARAPATTTAIIAIYPSEIAITPWCKSESEIMLTTGIFQTNQPIAIPTAIMPSPAENKKVTCFNLMDVCCHPSKHPQIMMSDQRNIGNTLHAPQSAQRGTHEEARDIDTILDGFSRVGGHAYLGNYRSDRHAPQQVPC